MFKNLPGIPLGICSRSFFGDFLLGFFSENLSGTFVQEVLLGYVTGISPEISSQSFFDNILQEFIRGLLTAIPPGISSRNCSEDLLQTFLRDFVMEFLQGFVQASGDFLQNVFIEFLLGFLPRTPLKVLKRISSGAEDFLQGFPPKIIPEIFFQKFLREFF